MSKARDLANAGTALTTVSATELGYLDGVTSAVQTQIDSKIGQSTAINPTIVDAKGDIIAASAADTVARLAVGANDTVLTADSSTGTGLKWATPVSGSMTLISTTTLSGFSTTITSIPSGYKNLFLKFDNILTDGPYRTMFVRLNGSSGTSIYTSVSAYKPGNSSSINGDAWLQNTELRIGDSMFGNNSATAYKGFGSINFYNYTTSEMKQGDYIFNGRSGDGGTFASGNFFVETTSAITSIHLALLSGSFSGGSVQLYGVN